MRDSNLATSSEHQRQINPSRYSENDERNLLCASEVLPESEIRNHNKPDHSLQSRDQATSQAHLPIGNSLSYAEAERAIEGSATHHVHQCEVPNVDDPTVTQYTVPYRQQMAMPSYQHTDPRTLDAIRCVCLLVVIIVLITATVIGILQSNMR